MNVLNDKTKETAPEIDFFHIATLVLFAGAAGATFLLAPLPVLIAQWKLPEPWPKVVALLGAVVAVFILEAPVPWAAVAFVLSIVFADLIKSKKGLWHSLASSTLAAVVSAFVIFLFFSRIDKSAPLAFWKDLVHKLVLQAQTSLQSGVQVDWLMIEKVFLYESPFLLAALCWMSCWVSFGLAIHFRLLGEPAAFFGKNLRKSVRGSVFAVCLAGGAYAAAILVPLPFYLAGSLRLSGCFLAVLGTVCLSDILNRRKVSKNGRTWVYVLAVLFGFYALVALGVVSPWYFRAAKLRDASAHEAVLVGEKEKT
jgi:hypothetical protein